MTIEYNKTKDFEKDLKKLLKKFKTLESDLETAKKQAITNFHINNIDNKGIVQIPKIGTEEIQIYKMVKFSCKALKGRGARSGIRITYAYHPEERKIKFIEMYFKADQENEDRERIKGYLKQFCKE